MAMNNIDQVRLQIGDLDEEEQYLDDDQITFFLQENGNKVMDASIACLEVIIASIALSPESLKVGEITEYAPKLEGLERLLAALIAKKNKGSGKMPFVVKSDRRNWCDIDNLYSRTGHPHFDY